MVRDIFRLARDNAPSIIFIDEVDSIATKRYDSQTGADREVQRVLVEILTQMDGFDQTTNVKVIMATNRADTLDPALLRPGRLDRKIEFPYPDRRQKRLIFQVITGKMNLSEEVDLEEFMNRPEKVSAADIAAICQEAGLLAVRKNRYVIIPKDFEKAYKNVIKKREKDYLRALQRYNIRIDLQTKTRSIDNESQCLANCMTSYRIATSACEYCGIGNWDLSAVNPNDDIDEIIRKNLDRLEYEQWCDYRTCILNADLEYEQCEDKC